MGPNQTDVESLKKPGSRRCRGLDCCLVLSVTVLFAGLLALTAAGALVILDLQSKLPQRSVRPEFDASKITGSAPAGDLKFKVENFAYVEATLSELKNHTMPLAEVVYLNKKSVGSNFQFNAEQHTLDIKQVGSYFLYVELNFTCVSRCEAGFLIVHLSDKLSCEVHLPHTFDTPVQRRCWTVTFLNKDTHLLAEMSLPRGPLHHWTLALQGSGVGVFQVN